MYAELHCHSAFSFLDGASLPEELAQQARALGYAALALTDHDGVYGSMAFAQFAAGIDLQAITGAEVTLEDGTHVTLLAETPRGYANLCRLLTQAHLTSPDRLAPRLPFEALVERQEGLIILSGCRRGVLATRTLTEMRARAHRCRELFGRERFFVELTRNAVRGDAARTARLVKVANELDLQLVATGNVHYHVQSRYRLHDVLIAIRHRTSLDASHAVRRPNSEFYLRPLSNVTRLYADRPDAVANTLMIAERCTAFDLTTDLGYRFPDFVGSDRAPAEQALAELCRTRIDERYPPGSSSREEAERRLSEELRLIEHHGLSGFFLVYRDLLELGREVAARVRKGTRRIASNLPPGRGRGSSVSSIVCYLIGLSGIDPVAHNLFLGRFLTETLASVPDIDLDFPREIREQLILEVYERYGAEHVGLVCSYPTYRLRSAVREVGKALDLPAGEIEQVARLADARRGAGALADELERLPGFAGRSEAPLWRELCELSEEIAGLPRHVSQHVGGMIISSRPLVEIVPLERAAMPGRVVCQWDKDSCDDARFIKIDFLALGMLSLVEECVELVAERTGTAPDLTRIDFSDGAVFDRIVRGDTVGLFQIESRAQIQMIKRVRPRNIHDLAIQVAIVRPGPIVGGAVNPYVKRREALRRDPSYRVPYAHPLLEEALGETLGVIIFQDQVLKVAQALADFTTGQAEALRRAMSRRRSHELLAGFWGEFKIGALTKGVDESTATEVFKQIVAFSQFGFPKSHAAAFALLAFQSAWLRHYHPVEYYAALFNNQPMGFYSLDALGRDAQRCGVTVLLPHINRSGAMCRVENGAVRVGLAFLRDWGLEAAELVVAERERNGPFASLSDLVRRVAHVLSRQGFENLVWVGGCDDFGLTRRELLWQVGLWLPLDGVVGGGPGPSRAVRSRRGRSRLQLELPLNQPFEQLKFRGLELDERVVAEYEMLGFATTAHPLALLREHVSPAVVKSDRLSGCEHGSTVDVAGLVVARQRPETAHGTVFVLMEDEAGMVNVIVRPKVFERYRVAIKREPFLWMRGKLAKDDGTLNIIAEEVEALHVEIGTATRLAPVDRNGQSDKHTDPYELLTSLRRVPPDVKEWG